MEMARRPNLTPEKRFTPEQLTEIGEDFAMLSTSSLQERTGRQWNGAGLEGVGEDVTG
jgi:hypothetical protein